MEHEDDGDTICNWCAQNIPQRICKGTGRLRNQMTSEDYPDYSIIDISKNTEKSLEDLRKLSFTQTPVKNHQLG